MSDAAAAASFHYLAHKVPEKPKAVYVEASKPLDFRGLYTPRPTDDFVLIGSSSKNFWRTRDDVKFSYFESRGLNAMMICCEDAKDVSKVYRTIVVSLEKLYFEVESKARGSREGLFKKKDKKLDNDAALWKGCIDFLLSRLNFPSDPLLWPSSGATGAGGTCTSGDVSASGGGGGGTTVATITTAASSTAPVITTPPTTASIVTTDATVTIADSSHSIAPVDNTSAGPKERMVTLDKSGTDSFDTLELEQTYIKTLVGHKALATIDSRLIRLVPSPPSAPTSSPAAITTAATTTATTTAAAAFIVAAATVTTEAKIDSSVNPNDKSAGKTATATISSTSPLNKDKNSSKVQPYPDPLHAQSVAATTKASTKPKATPAAVPPKGSSNNKAKVAPL